MDRSDISDADFPIYLYPINPIYPQSDNADSADNADLYGMEAF